MTVVTGRFVTRLPTVAGAVRGISLLTYGGGGQVGALAHRHRATGRRTRLAS
ncbi:MAG TPA: hypothetical protein VHV74_17655 [Pseudonocardiaceae bacterium]|nr:hypothetical protein [Pseudonocardiaceae bacterium]